jgi:uncharacterized protein YkwD
MVIMATFSLGSSSEAAQTVVAYSAEEVAFVRLLNEYREGHGLQPLLVSDALSEAGDRHGLDMGNHGFFDHYTLEDSDWFEAGTSPGTRMAASGYSASAAKGENIAAGYADAAAVFAAWQDSPAHDANMLDADFVVLGISLVEVEGSEFGHYWTTDFGGFVDPAAHSPD